MFRQIGRKIYYEKSTGNKIVDTGERQGAVVETTVQQDFESYSELSERNPESVDLIVLEFGELSEDFATSNGVRVNIETGKLEFSYPDPNEPEAPPVFQEPLSSKVVNLELENAMLQMSMMEMTMYAASQDERLQTQENAVMELSMIVAGGGL